MKVVGRRADGALNLSIGAGMAVLVRAGKKSPPIDATKAQKLGPWFPADNSLGTRRALEEQLSLSHVVPLEAFALGMSFDEQRDRVLTSLRQRMGIPAGGNYPMAISGGSDIYIPQNGMGEDWVVYCQQGKHYGLVYDITPDGSVRFEGDAVPVTSTWETLADRAEDAAETDKEPTPFDETIRKDDEASEVEPIALNFFRKIFAKKKKKSQAQTIVQKMQPMKRVEDVPKPEPHPVQPLYSVAAVTKPDVKIVKPIKQKE